MSSSASIPHRTRTFTWDDPLQGAEVAKTMCGLDYLHAMLAGKLPAPPIGHALDFKGVEASEGRAVFEFTPQEFHYNPIGSVHGGVITTLMDSAMGCAVHSTLPAGTGYMTLELKVNFIRGIGKNTGTLQCIGTMIQGGGRVAVSEAKLVDAKGRLYAHDTSTCLILRP